jgi:hypothetical protein
MVRRALPIGQGDFPCGKACIGLRRASCVTGTVLKVARGL